MQTKNTLIKNYIKLLFETTRFTQDSSDELNSERLSSMSDVQSLDKTHMSAMESIQDILSHIDESTFISFVDKYDEDIPRLGVSPKIEYKTPHGIYGYPLSKDNLRNMLFNRRPTEAKFATKRPYMHVYKITTPDAVILQRVDGKIETNKYTSVDGIRKALEDSKNSILNFLRRLDGISEESFARKNKHFMSDVNSNTDYKPTIEMYKSESKAFFVSYVNQLRMFLIHCILYSRSLSSDKQSYFREVSDDILTFLLSNIKESRNYNEISNKHKGYPFFVLFFVIRALTIIASHMIASGNLFVQLLSDAGIKSIIDRNTATIHRNEPNQAFVSSLAPDTSNFKLIGTYNNPLLIDEEEMSRITDEVLVNFDMPDYASNLEEIYKIIKKEIEFDIHDDKAVAKYCNDLKYEIGETEEELVDPSIIYRFEVKYTPRSVMENLTTYFNILRRANCKLLIALLFTKSRKAASTIDYFLARNIETMEQDQFVELIADYGHIKRKFDKE